MIHLKLFIKTYFKFVTLMLATNAPVCKPFSKTISKTILACYYSQTFYIGYYSISL